MQIGIPRDVTNPYISIRYKENNVLKAWQKISAGQADQLTTARNIAGTSFNGTADIPISYNNLTNKLTAGTGISISASNVIRNVWTQGTLGNIYYHPSTVVEVGQTDFVGIGTSAPETKLHVVGKACINTGSVGPPGNGTYGANNGTRLVLWPGGSSDCPYALGVDNSTLWYGCPAGTSHKWYLGTTNSMKHDTNGIYLYNGWFRNHGYSGLYNETYACHFYPNDSQYGSWRIHGNNVGGWGGIRFSESDVSLMMGNGNNKYCGFHYNTGSVTGWSLHSDPNKNVMVDYRLGIGAGTPSTRLHVGYSSSSAYGGGSSRWFNSTGFTSTTYTNITFSNVCAIFGSAVLAFGDYISVSDTRIKKEIEDINDDSALQKILAIQPKTYKYIDEINKGPNKVYGFIAQQIKEIIPEAISVDKNTIPNIYKVCDCSLNKIYVDISNATINTKIDIIDLSENKNTYTITDISENFITIDKDISGNKCFVYGTEVDDFHALNKDYIFTLNVCATQELNKKIDQQNQTINDLINRITQLENIINNLST